MARFEGLGTGMAENFRKLGNSQFVAMEIQNADFEAPFGQEGVRLCHNCPLKMC